MEQEKEIAELRQRLATLEARGSSRGAVPKSKGLAGKYLLWGLAAFFALAVFGRVVGRFAPTNENIASSSTNTINNSAQSAARGTTGNLINDNLLSKTPTQQARILGAAVGEGCRGKKAFYMGTGHSGLADGMSYWSVSCRNGRNYMVQLSPDDKNNKVLECSMYQAIGGGRCFAKL